MPSLIALRAVIGASLGFGVLDLVWINVALAPKVVAHEEADTLAVEVAPVAPPAPAPAPAPVPAVAAEPPPEPPPAPVAAPSRHAVYFETSSAKLDAEARDTLADIVASAPADAVFALEGHADYRGDEALNDRLSRDRAQTVAHALTGLGVAAKRVRVEYAGESNALANAASEVWRDRRVDIVITGGSR